MSIQTLADMCVNMHRLTTVKIIDAGIRRHSLSSKGISASSAQHRHTSELSQVTGLPAQTAAADAHRCQSGQRLAQRAQQQGRSERR